MQHIKLTGGPSEGSTPSGCCSPPACDHPQAACLCRQGKNRRRQHYCGNKACLHHLMPHPNLGDSKLPSWRTANLRQIPGRDSLTCEDEPLLIRRDTLLVLNFRLDHVDGVGRLHLQGDGLARQLLSSMRARAVCQCCRARHPRCNWSTEQELVAAHNGTTGSPSMYATGITCRSLLSRRSSYVAPARADPARASGPRSAFSRRPGRDDP